jgi:hypothetical protein
MLSRALLRIFWSKETNLKLLLEIFVLGENSHVKKPLVLVSDNLRKSKAMEGSLAKKTRLFLGSTTLK